MAYVLAFIRSALHMLWMALTVIPWAIFVIIASLFVSPTRMYWMCAGWLQCAMWGLKVVCGVHWKVHGLENLPQGEKEGAVLLCKHQSTMETFLLPCIMPHPLAYVFKRELLYVPFFGWAMARMDMIHIDRSKRSEAFNKVVGQGKRVMAQGVWVIMFPEGTRIARGQQGSYKTGGTRLACETGRPVVPIAVNCAKHWPRKAFVKTPGVIDVVIGPQISSQGREPDEMMREVQSWIEAKTRELDPQAYVNSSAGAG
jgi:1-acyl-sn-glycerol-3-phosphate acyltransferase